MSWWRRVTARRALDRDLDRELADHFERQVQDNLQAGMSAAEARRRAALSFGSAESVKEECRDARGTRWLIDAARDARQAARQMRRHPATTAISAVSLGLGIGAVIAMFSLVDAVLLRPLPVPEPDRLVLLAEHAPAADNLSWSVSQLRSFAASPSLAGICAFRPRTGFTVPRGDGASIATGQLLSGGCYRTLGLRPERGRLFTEEDERAGDARPVAVISDEFWRRQFAADPGVVGRPLDLTGHVVTIVGITPPEFSGLEPGRAVDISLPLSLQPWAFPVPFLRDPNARWLRIIGRLARDTSRERAASELGARWAQLGAQPSGGPASSSRFELLDGAQGLNDLRTQFSRPLKLLLAASGLLLLLVCANLASLTVARNRLRAVEVTLRLALGASRGRLIRQLFTESFVLAATAGAAGVTIGLWASRSIVALLSRGRTPIVLSLGLNVRMLAAALVTTVVTGVVFGLWPALRSSQADVQAGLQVGARTLVGTRGARWNVLIAAQAALCTVLVVAGALFGRSLARLYAADIGIQRQQVTFVVAGAGMVGAATVPQATVDAFYERLSRAAEIQSLTTALDLPFHGVSSYRANVSVPERPRDRDLQAGFNFVGPRFFQTMGIPLLAGRDIGETDDPQHPEVGVISQSLARQLFQTGDPIGRTLRAESRDIEVIGVARDVPYESVRSERELTLYRPARQAWTGPTTVAVRSTASPAVVAALARRTLHELAPDVPVSITSAADQFDASIATERLLADIAAFLGLMSLLLVAIGMYGTLASALAQRTREFGLRRALGASDAMLVRMIVARALTPVAVGLAVGLPGSFALARLGGAMLFGITPRDPATYCWSVGVLVAVAALAALAPSRSAVRVNTVAALRES